MQQDGVETGSFEAEAIKEQEGSAGASPLCRIEPSSRNISTQSGGYLGCCVKSQPIIAVDEPSKGLRIQGQVVKKPSISEDFWSTSTCDMENSQVKSQRSLSSISLSNQSLNQYSGTGSTSNCFEFINHVGMQIMKAYWALASVSLSQFLSLKWSSFLWIYGNKRDCMVEKDGW
ncbi:unnamed protein product [Fraxinus pennsylvanica]|uniref:Uncharacterized protein n=1 Tax=Fraxinus pennsylvanica TaxID=56036 RepID=A0AAD1YY00_9LAMI|nr:unnamed protein product [Fraxinus pennsylvanica]